MAIKKRPKARRKSETVDMKDVYAQRSKDAKWAKSDARDKKMRRTKNGTVAGSATEAQMDAARARRNEIKKRLNEAKSRKPR